MEEKSSNSTWEEQPVTSEWNDPRNWESNNVPHQKATFTKSDKTVITFSTLDSAKVKEIEFAPGAPSFSFRFGSSPIKPSLEISGFGIVNLSGHPQNFIVAATAANFRFPQLKFSNYATAGGSDMSYHSGPESLENGYGGGIIGFSDHATAGTAHFIVRTGKLAPPKTERSTVGGEVAFCDFSTAERAEFTIYGSLGIDGDTFGNTVFHDNATAAHGRFTNIGGTVAGGDGGNTQFYDSSSAAYGVFQNYGGTFYKANGGDVAFDGIASGAHAHFHNYPATVENGNGGVTSFNNNPPEMNTQGASAGHGIYHNYGATEEHRGGGGHTEFTAKYGCPTAAKGNFINYGSAIPGKSTAGHTIFSINFPTQHFPTAGHGVFRNLPALNAGAAPGNTAFAVYMDSVQGGNGPTNQDESVNPFTNQPKDKVPTAGDGIFINEGGFVEGASGGFTSFSGVASAGNARLIAHGGINGGNGGQIIFSDWANGGTSHVLLFGNGELDLSELRQSISIGVLELAGGIISMGFGEKMFGLNLTDKLVLNSASVAFNFILKASTSMEFNKSYQVLTAPNLACFNEGQFVGNALDGISPTFKILG
ncbi:MAG TPA: hypothetical protein VLA71_00620, partial [Algoriphagus sp.]|nr:hypothetical protein [Algoriphagus sp.]